MSLKNCTHCRGADYVFEYWLEKILDQNGVHMTEIPSHVFEKIPLEVLCFCHCNALVTRYPRVKGDPIVHCEECDGSTWRFTETAEEAGYRWKKVVGIDWMEIKELPCEYFERCPCGADEKGTKTPGKKKAVKELFDLLKIKLPQLGFGLPTLCNS